MSPRPSDDMLNRYAQGELSPKEEEMLEIALMDEPDLLDRARFDWALSLARRSTKKNRVESRSFLFRLVPAFSFAITAGCLLWVVQERQYSAKLAADLANATTPTTGAQTITLDVVRGFETLDATVLITSEPKHLMIRSARKDWANEKLVRFEFSEDGRVLLSNELVYFGQEIVFGINTNNLSTGKYLAEIRGESAIGDSVSEKVRITIDENM